MLSSTPLLIGKDTATRFLLSQTLTPGHAQASSFRASPTFHGNRFISNFLVLCTTAYLSVSSITENSKERPFEN